MAFEPLHEEPAANAAAGRAKMAAAEPPPAAPAPQLSDRHHGDDHHDRRPPTTARRHAGQADGRSSAHGRRRPRSSSPIEVLASTGGAVIRISGDGEFPYSTFALTEPRRFVVDLGGVINRSPRPAVQVDGGVVERVRVAQFKPAPKPVARVVFDLKGDSLPTIERTGNALVVSFPAANGAPAPAVSGAAPASAMTAPPPSAPARRPRRLRRPLRRPDAGDKATKSSAKTTSKSKVTPSSTTASTTTTTASTTTAAPAQVKVQATASRRPGADRRRSASRPISCWRSATRRPRRRSPTRGAS